LRDTGAPLTGQGPVDYGNGLIAECSPVTDGVQCFPANSVEAHLGDMNDRARVVIASGPGTVWAGPGDDQVSMDSFGLFTRAYGEEGDDELRAGGEGGQLVDGGPGDDLLHVGGFAGHATGIGGPGRDRLVFRASLAATGHMDGGSGDDHLSLQAGVPTEALGGNGDDLIDVPGRPPGTQLGGHTIRGGNGSDTLSGGPDADVIDGGQGADSIDVAGGGEDTVTCGQGRDTVRADSSDSIAADCEVIEPGD
jgi:Ca2+-binding RTX toxin-like protein